MQGSAFRSGPAVNTFNVHLFELINAAPGLASAALATATALATGPIWLVPVAMTIAWFRGDDESRRELLEMLLAVIFALGLAQVIAHVWPQPRPFKLHLGTTYIKHAADPGLPSDHVTILWSLALAALSTRRFAIWGLPLLTTGLLVGWSRVYLGVHFPFDVLAAFPVALFGAVIARSMRTPMLPIVAKILHLHHWLERFLPAPWHRRTKP